MAKNIPWGYEEFDSHYFPAEEYQVSRVLVDEQTGREEVLHYSHGQNDDIFVHNYNDPYNYDLYNP